MKKIKGAVPLRQSPKYHENEARAHGFNEVCIACGKGIRRVAIWWLRLGPMGTTYVIPSNAPDQGPAEMGCWPIGDDCLKSRPELKRLVFKMR